MKDTTISNLLIPLLLLFFFAVPSLLKLMGRNNPVGRDRDARDKETSNGSEMRGPENPWPPTLKDPGTEKGLYEETGRTQISNRPITPKWF